MTVRPLPPLIAVVGSDGSGKSTVTHELQTWLAEFHPTVVCHLGKQSGNIGRSLARLPLIGSRLGKTIDKKAGKAQTDQGPDLVTAIGIYGFVLRRVSRFQQMLRLRRAGNLIIADRFPQLERPGPMDGLGLANAKTTGIIGMLARSERRQLSALVAHLPDLVLRLNVSLDVAIARKPDHSAEGLARKIVDMSHLTLQGAKIVDIDADAPLANVLTDAKQAIAEMLDAKYGIKVPVAPKSS